MAPAPGVHHRIAIVTVFFGTPPLWLPAFLLSCRANPDVEWIIYTDFRTDDAATTVPNVTFKAIDLREFIRRSSDTLATRINIVDPRKVCDLKPAYGVIFESDLKPFDFWAYSDLDIVWGDVRRFLDDGLLANYDIVSSRRKRLSGHFTLFRNDALTNRTFDLIPAVAEAFANPAHLCLDEHLLTDSLRERLTTRPGRGWPRVRWTGGLTMDSAYQKSLGSGPDDRLWWRNGKTFDAHGRELMYLHFHKLKKRMRTFDFDLGSPPAAFSIDRQGFRAE